MIKTQKAHIVYTAFTEEYVLRRQIRMNYIVLMQKCKQVDYFYCYFYGFKLTKKRPLRMIIVQILS
jgi:hypothetical protein